MREDDKKIDWSYSGDTGPDHWGKLWPIACDGKSQSPVEIKDDLIGEGEGGFSPLRVDYGVASFEVTKKTHSFSVVPAEAEENLLKLHIGNNAYILREIHFHSPAEHRINGEEFGMEAHLLHETPEGEICVLAVLFILDDDIESAALKEVIASQDAQLTLDLNYMLPASRDYYAYIGSRTSPPCEEGLRWLVMKGQLRVTSAQVSRLCGFLGSNNRPIQALNGRKVYTSK